MYVHACNQGLICLCRPLADTNAPGGHQWTRMRGAAAAGAWRPRVGAR